MSTWMTIPELTRGVGCYLLGIGLGSLCLHATTPPELGPMLVSWRGRLEVAMILMGVVALCLSWYWEER